MMVIMVVIVKTGALLVRMIIEMVVGWPLLAMPVTFKKLVFGTAEARMDSCEQSFPMNTWMKILGAAMVAESRQLRAGPEAQLRPRQLRVETELFCIFPSPDSRQTERPGLLGLWSRRKARPGAKAQAVQVGRSFPIRVPLAIRDRKLPELSQLQVFRICEVRGDLWGEKLLDFIMLRLTNSKTLRGATGKEGLRCQ